MKKEFIEVFGNREAETVVTKKGVRYSVTDRANPMFNWSKTVAFGYGGKRPAGPAFRQAAMEQQRKLENL